MTKELVLGLTHLVILENGVSIKMLSISDFISFSSISKIELVPAGLLPGHLLIVEKSGKKHALPFNVYGDMNAKLKEAKTTIEEKIRQGILMGGVVRKQEEPTKQALNVNTNIQSLQPLNNNHPPISKIEKQPVITAQKRILPQPTTQREDKMEKIVESTMSVIGRLGGMYNNFMADQQHKREIEEARIQKLLLVGPPTIKVSMNLEDGEKAYIQFSVKRKAVVETFTQHTEGVTKKSGGITRAIIGNMLWGSKGAVVGATTAGSKYKEITKVKKEAEIKTVDEGYLTLTNKRMIFDGKNKIFVVSLNNIISINFAFLGYSVSFKYPDMLEGEEYQITQVVDGNFDDCKIYFLKKFYIHNYEEKASCC